MRAFSFFDRKAGSYGIPQFFSHTADAVRNLSILVNDPASNSALSKFSADFDLYSLGDWDAERGMIDQPEPPVFLLNLATLKEAPNAQA